MRWNLAVLLVLTLLLLSGSAYPASMPVVRYVNFKVYDPVYVALDKAFFVARGVRVFLMGEVLAGPPAIAAVAGGSADAALSSVPAVTNAAAAGLPIVGVSDIQSSLPTQPMEEYFVRVDSPIRSIPDVRGKRFAVNLWRSSFHYTALMALEQVGIPDTQVQFLLLPFPEQILALDRGQVDVIGLIEPYATYARQAYGTKFRRLFTALDIFGNKQISVHFFNRNYAARNPAAVTAWVGAIGDAILWTYRNQPEAKRIVGKYTGLDPAHIPDVRFQRDGRVVVEDCDFWLAYLRRRGDVTNTTIQGTDFCTNAYNPRLMRP